MTNMQQQKKQYVWLIRHGQTKFPIYGNASCPPCDCDISDAGLEHAKLIAKRVMADPTKQPGLVYSSSSQRSVHTAQLIALGQRHQTRAVCVEDGIRKWSQPQEDGGKHSMSTPTRTMSLEDLASRYGTIDTSYRSVNGLHDDDCGSNHNGDIPTTIGGEMMPESEDALFQRCRTTMSRLLDAHHEDENLAIVSHAPCNQMMALYLATMKGGADATKAGSMGFDDAMSTLQDQVQGAVNPHAFAWPLGGVTLFSRDVALHGEKSPSSRGGWKLEFYACTEHMPGRIYKSGLQAWTLPSFKNIATMGRENCNSKMYPIIAALSGSGAGGKEEGQHKNTPGKYNNTNRAAPVTVTSSTAVMVSPRRFFQQQLVSYSA